MAIVEALGEIGGDAAREALNETARDSRDAELREAARAALLRLEESSA